MTTFNDFTTQQIEELTAMNEREPISDFEGFFKANSHLSKEIGYSLGMIQGYREATGGENKELSHKNKEIIDIMQDIFDRS
jgi:hypothetical protein